MEAGSEAGGQELRAEAGTEGRTMSQVKSQEMDFQTKS